MPHVYIIESTTAPRWYLGVTSRNLQQRLEEYNRGQTRSTRNFSPWIHIYQEEYSTFGDALKREKYLKSITGYKERLSIIEIYKQSW